MAVWTNPFFDRDSGTALKRCSPQPLTRTLSWSRFVGIERRCRLNSVSLSDRPGLGQNPSRGCLSFARFTNAASSGAGVGPTLCTNRVGANRESPTPPRSRGPSAPPAAPAGAIATLKPLSPQCFEVSELGVLRPFWSFARRGAASRPLALPTPSEWPVVSAAVQRGRVPVRRVRRGISRGREVLAGCAPRPLRERDGGGHGSGPIGSTAWFVSTPSP